MKKFIAVILAVIMAFGCSAAAFADTTYTCPGCGCTFTSGSDYNSHLGLCADYKKYASDLTSTTASTTASTAAETSTKVSTADISTEIHYAVDKLVAIFQTNAGWWDAIEDVVIRLIDFVEDMINLSVSQGEVAGAVEDLEAEVGDLGIAGDILSCIESLLTTIKQKIKDFYAGNKETVIDETTAAEAPAETGSPAGITVFAVLSMAAAAAFVCTKKKENR